MAEAIYNCIMPPPADSNVNSNSADSDLTDFGFADVAAAEKPALVGEVFSRVAPYYDCMNDLMSAGAHRLWKRAAAQLSAARPGMRVLDLACGGGDLAARILPSVAPGGRVVLADVNERMLAKAKKRLGKNSAAAFVRCDGESLPFADGMFDRALIGFGLRNIARREKALGEMRRVLRPGGLCSVLEFSPPQGRSPLAVLQRAHLRAGLPFLGGLFFGDAASYRYLGESILRFPDKEKLAAMMTAAGFECAEYFNFAAGAVCLHRARRLT